MKQCPSCKAFYPDDDDFCPADGASLTRPPQSSEQDIPTEIFTPSRPTGSVTGTRGTSPWVYIAAGAIGTVLILGVIYLLRSNNDKPANEKFVNVASSPANQAPTRTPAAANDNQAQTSVPSAPAAPAASPKGHWTGDWSSPSGAYLTIAVDLDDDGAGKVTGQIEWTLRRTTRPDKMSKIGLSATEYVSGTFDAATRTLSMKGYRKDDPNNVLVMLDVYRLNLSGDQRRLNGNARNGGKWNAAINLAR